MEISFKNILQVGGWTMYVLLFCSVVVLAVVLERTYVFFKFGKEFKIFKNNLNKNLKINTPLFSSLLKVYIPQDDLSEFQKEKMYCANITKIQIFLDKNLPVLATIGSMAPFIGLFGTVLGIMKAFKQLSIQKGAGIDVVGAGIAEALVCTAAGLFVAIVSVILYNFFKAKAKRLVDEFEAEMAEYLAGALK